MNKKQKEVLQSQLNDEEKIIRELKQVYKKANDDVVEKIKALEAREDVENMSSIVYQKQYQEALKKQLDAILDVMNTDQFDKISDYLSNCYESGFVGAVYDLHGQKIPLIMPIDQEQVVKAIQTDSKISEGLYKKLGVDTKVLKNSIRANVSRGIAASLPWADVARNIDNRMKIGMNKSFRIARTEGHRISNQAAFDAQNKAKSKGADIVKQWDATLDSSTRETHAQLDGQIREIDEPFESGTHKAMFPGDFGVAAEDCNCRCAVLQRARWALDEDELKTLQERAEYFGLDKTDSFEEFKTKYMKVNEIENKKLQSQFDLAQKEYDAIVKKYGSEEKLYLYGDVNDLAKSGTLKKQINDIGKQLGKNTTKPAVSVPKAKSKTTFKGKKFKSNSEALEYHYKTNFSKDLWDNDFTANERDGIYKYTGSSYFDMNRALRKGNYKQYADSRTQKLIENATSALQKTTVAEDITVFRGMGGQQALSELLGVSKIDLAEPSFQKTLIGRRCTEKGFMSTAVISDSAWSGIQLEVQVPAGSHGMYVDPISQHSGENELLLQRNSTFEILNYETNTYGEVTKLVLRLVEQKLS